MKLRYLALAATFTLAFPLLAFADGSQSYTSPGTYTFTVPSYGTLTVTVNGAGGGGSSGGDANYNSPGADGGDSSFNGNVAGYGGSGASIGQGNPEGGTDSSGGGTTEVSYAGTPGGASGGDVNTNTTGGGGSGGAGESDPNFPGAAGGNGGQAVLTYSAGTLSAGPVTVIVGSGGAGGVSAAGEYDPACSCGGNGYPGQDGSVNISWTSAPTPTPAPTCSITFAQNPLTGDSTTMSWTSSNATLLYINQVGYVGASGSTQVYSPGDYSGSVSGPGGTGSCPATLQSGSGPNLCPDGSAAPNGDPNQCTCQQGNESACADSCSSGETWNGSECAEGGGSCPEGEFSEAGSCVQSCDIGYTQEGDSCIFSGCPTGYSEEGNECVFVSCPTDYTEETDSNGNPECVQTACSAGYICQSGNLYYQNASCTVSSSPSQTCSYGCSSGACNAPPAATLDIIAVPSLIQSQETTNVSWSAENVDSCTISGTDGENWSCQGGECGATTTETSLPITAQTTFTLNCLDLTDTAVPPQAATVTIAPSFCETGAPGCP